MTDFLVEEDGTMFDKFFTKAQRKRLERKQKREEKQHQHQKATQKQSEFRNTKTISLEARTKNQQRLINSIIQYDQIVAVGPAGTGKTYIATVSAAKMLLERRITKIVLTRPNVSASRSVGLLPGGINEKFSAWASPFIEILKEVMGPASYEIALKRGDIEMVPFEFMRGRTFDNAYIMVDESQSTTKDEMICLVTRIGEGSKLLMMGDIRQKDISATSGLEFVIDSTKKNADLRERVGLVEFTIDDVVRSDVCSLWVRHIYA